MRGFWKCLQKGSEEDNKAADYDAGSSAKVVYDVGSEWQNSKAAKTWDGSNDTEGAAGGMIEDFSSKSV